MPDRAPARRFVADLSVEVGDEHGSTTATLVGDGDVVLDVGDPVVLLRCLPGQGARTTLPPGFPTDLLTGHTVELRSSGRDLGRLRVTSSGRVSFRPSWSGAPTLARTAVSVARSRTGSGRLALGAGSAVVVAAVALVVRVLVRRRPLR